jgi:ABC-type Fe3+ transport system permease subunit
MMRRAGIQQVALALLIALAALSVGIPLLGVARGIAESAPAPAPDAPPLRVDWLRLARSLGVAGQIGILATLIAWPAAWTARRLPAPWFGVLLVPMLMPSYLAFIGWSQLRAPGFWLGDFLMRGPPDGGGGGANWWPVAAARVCATGGLVLWSWPLAMLILSIRVRRVHPDVLDSLQMEPAGGLRRVLTLLNLCRGALAAAAGAVSLVMLGSAVPLHIAQLDTYAIEIWRLLDLAPASGHWRVWAAAWPLLLIALVGAALITARTTRDEASGVPEVSPRPSGGTLGVVVTALVWVMAVLVPGGLMAMDLGGWHALESFWRSHADALAVSAAIALVVATLGGLLCVCVWIALSAWRGSSSRGLGRVILAALIATALVPGVLIGSASSAAWSWFGTDSDAASLTSLVLAHVARLGFIGALVGWWAHRSESRDERSMRLIDGAGTLRGWLAASWPTQAGPVLAGALAIGLLSLHEIEAAVMLQPPGLDSFARQMLQLLHYNRVRDLSAAVVSVLGIGLLLSGAIVALASVRRR